MPRFKLHSFRTDADLADEVASRWLAELSHQASKKPFCVALSGGRIARRFYAAIAGKAKSGADLSSVHFFWGDERCVPPTDPESNFGLARDLLFGPLRILEAQIHRVRGEDPPEAAAAAAAAELCEFTSPEAVTRGKAAHFGAEIAHLNELEIAPDVIAAIPRHIAWKYRVVPVSKQANGLTIALEDPSDLDTIDSLNHLLRLDLNMQVASESDIEAALAKYYPISDSPRVLITEASADQIASRTKEKTCALGQPVLDLVLLGLGEDGHIASLFPGEPEAVRQDPAVFRAVTASKPPPRRITLGYGAIAAARQVWVLASGAGKETALHESLRPGGATPLARMLGLRTDTVIFTDIESAEH